MLRDDFKEIINDNMQFHGKRFVGNESERMIDYDRFIFRYYESLGHLSEGQLELGFKKCRESVEYFPKINQLLKFCPELKKPDPVIFYKKTVPIPPNIKLEINKIHTGPSLNKLGSELIGSMKAMVSIRFGCTEWNETFAKWDQEELERT